ncbi:hypothetical protein VTL71DRAFT_2975 [Oculimacula yallundae]|uniref:Uncharacterized protein n=1 Tax=Oculimacula yallundae TaxID=86028 RepID=A0ABR4C5U5_9HELO
MAIEMSFDLIRIQGGEPEKQDKEHNSRVWLDAVNTGPEFKPDIRTRPKRQAFINAEKAIVYRVQKNKNRKKTKLGKDQLLPFEEAVFWAAVEPETADMTEDFIKATAKPFEERTTREHDVIRLYWNLGYSLDPVLNFESSEVTQRHLESRMYGVIWSGKNEPSTKIASAKEIKTPKSQFLKQTRRKCRVGIRAHEQPSFFSSHQANHFITFVFVSSDQFHSLVLSYLIVHLSQSIYLLNLLTKIN